MEWAKQPRIVWLILCRTPVYEMNCHAHKHATENSNTARCRRWNAWGETIADVRRHTAMRLFYVVKWETNCRVASWNGSWPRLRVINSLRCAPLITAAGWSDSWRQGSQWPRATPMLTTWTRRVWNILEGNYSWGFGAFNRTKKWIPYSVPCATGSKNTHKSRIISISTNRNYACLHPQPWGFSQTHASTWF